MPRVGLVVGGSGGMGSAIVRNLVAQGMMVYATYHKNQSQVQKLKEECGAQVQMLSLDVCDPGSVKDALEPLVKKGEKFDVIVYAVTDRTDYQPVLKSEWAAYQAHHDLQVKGFFHLIKNLTPQIQVCHRTKVIVVLTEYCVGTPPSSLSAYVSAKYALMGFAKSLAAELARYHWTVNMVSPGMTETPLLEKLPSKLLEITAESNPLKRLGRPADTAAAIGFLASDGADYLNGTNILVNGGSKQA